MEIIIMKTKVCFIEKKGTENGINLGSIFIEKFLKLVIIQGLIRIQGLKKKRKKKNTDRQTDRK